MGKKIIILNKTGFVCFLVYMAVFFSVFFGMLAAMNEFFTDRFVVEADTLVQLLEGYGKQQLWMFGVAVTAIVILVIAAVLTLAFHIRSLNMINPGVSKIWYILWNRMFQAHLLMVCFLCVPVLMLKETRLTENYRQFQADAEAVHEGRLKSEAVFFHPDHEPVDFVLWSPKGYADTAVRYSGIGIGKSGERIPVWEDFYVPGIMDFTLDTEHPYDENRDRLWNEQNAAWYHITYTPNLHFVVSVEVENHPVEK